MLPHTWSAKAGVLRISLKCETNALQWITHQSVLCAKLSGDLKEVMDKTMKMINFIRGNSQYTPFYPKFALQSQATHNDLLLHNDVRCEGKARSTSLNSGIKLWIFISKANQKEHLTTCTSCKTEYNTICNVAFF